MKLIFSLIEKDLGHLVDKTTRTMALTPKEFEILLLEFCKQDLPQNFIVEHDAKDIGEESENKRQIDVRIRGKLGISDILICGEAKNWDEKVGIETIDAVVGKYMAGEIRASKIILFSNMGFSKPAIKRAKKRSIELLEPKDIGKPIQNVPYILAIGNLATMQIHWKSTSLQYNMAALNPEDYIIIKGEERISFQQNIFRLLILEMKKEKTKPLSKDLTSFKIRDINVLYELRQKEGYRYHGDFEIDLLVNWSYFVEYLPTGVLHHINSGNTKIVQLSNELVNNVIASPTRVDYSNKQDCIEKVALANPRFMIKHLLADPDTIKSQPEEPRLIEV